MFTNPSLQQDFGFLFLSSSESKLSTHSDFHGHPRLEVHLNDQPSFEHFDPEHVEFTAKIPSGTSVPYLDDMSLFHPWAGGSAFEVGCGHIFIYDRKGKKVDAFTFGGTVHLQVGKGLTIAVFESPAPILEVTPVNPAVDLFVDEVEILLAMRRAAWLKKTSNIHAYETRLALANPVDLYVACLLDVEKRLTHSHGGEDAKEMHLRCVIRAELQALKNTGVWLGVEKGLDEVV